MKETKTNAMRMLDKAKINYQLLQYDLKDEKFSGLKVSENLGLNPETCFKTLALEFKNELFLVAIPVNKEIDLKKCAQQIGVKSLEMIAVKDLIKKVGYQRGSVSPLGVNNKHRCYFSSEALNFKEIEISAGKMGLGLVIDRAKLLTFLNAEIIDVCK